jgi:hypothetical protein
MQEKTEKEVPYIPMPEGRGFTALEGKSYGMSALINQLFEGVKGDIFIIDSGSSFKKLCKNNIWQPTGINPTDCQAKKTGSEVSQA